MPPRSSKFREDSIPCPGKFIRPAPTHYYTYRIQCGEQGVLTYEPYKSHLLPLWRFRTPSIAEKSSTALFDEFLRFYKEDDFVGMDMSRKFIQMGMTRSKRYANYKGGRKYDNGKNGEKVERDKSQGHEGQGDKLVASGIFKEMWQRCREHEGYKVLKERYQKELKNWIQVHESEEAKYIKQEEGEEELRDMPRRKPPGEAKEKVKIKEEDNTEEIPQKQRKKRKTNHA
ncbi:hypothetical protein EYC80_001947 [Monilinia laxa]|nr:hypothetical protein EYC80_001947 [Monilinia laxa]